MPKVGMEPVRKKQLIEATIEVVAQVGLHATTISLISKQAGLSSGIVSHYFGGKQGLIEASMRYLLDELRIKDGDVFGTAEERLIKIIENNFSSVQQAESATKTWLSFWAQSLHTPGLGRIQRVNQSRLVSNLKYSFKQVMPADKASEAAATTAALIDGYWLRCSLSHSGPDEFDRAKRACIRFVQTLLGQQS